LASGTTGVEELSVKSHTRIIFRKLGIARARELGLI
jgi:hypothetical protein